MGKSVIIVYFIAARRIEVKSEVQIITFKAELMYYPLVSLINYLLIEL